MPDQPCPCGEESCIGPCADTHGRCIALDGCCDPENQEDDDE
jgi:hypothetical protein